MTEMPAGEKIRQRPAIKLARRAFRLAYWNEESITRDKLIGRLLNMFARGGHPAIPSHGWNDYDLELRPNPWTRVEIKTADEEHPGLRLKNHVAARIKLTLITVAALTAGGIAAAILLAAGLPELAMAAGALTIAAAVCVLGEMIDAGRIAYRAIEECAAELNLIPLGKPLRAHSGATAAQPAFRGAQPPAAAQLAAQPGPAAQ